MSILAVLDYSNTHVSGTQTVGQVQIALIDGATGLPVNGNGIVILYHQNINGAEFDGQVPIYGTSSGIYSGLLRDTNPSAGYFTTFAITGQNPAPPPPPPVNLCDLVINSINVNTPESSPGANDAKITVSATTSYPAIQYSLDNITFQSSPIFDGISGGVKTVYVTDANPTGCTNQSNVTIPILRNLLASDPGVNTSGSNVSRWNAAFNPIVFTYQRKDFEVTSAVLYIEQLPLINITGTTFAINGDLTTLAATIAANRLSGANQLQYYAYINAGNYKGTYLILNCTANSISVLVPFVATAAGFMNSDNMRPYYKIITQIQYNDPLTGQAFIVNSNNRSRMDGSIRADLSTFLKSLLKATDLNGSDYNHVNYRDYNLSASYRIAYCESWDDGSDSGYQSAFIQLASTYYVTYTARQLGDKYGGNMGEYVPFKIVTPPAKWVTDFKTPVHSIGFPFDMSFIYGEDLAGLQLYYQITLLDINKNPLPNAVSIGYLLNEDQSYLLNQDGSRLIISEVALGNVPIVEQVGLNRLLIDYNFPDNAYYFNIGIFYNDISNNPVQVIATQTVRIDKDCDLNSVYLRWIGKTGSWAYYRFIWNQEKTLDVQNATVITRYVNDWENNDTIEDVVIKAASKKMQVHAEDMLVEDIEGCEAMKYSPKVQLLVSKSPVKWQTIVLNTATFAESETNSPVYSFAVTFNLPGVNVQSQ